MDTAMNKDTGLTMGIRIYQEISITSSLITYKPRFVIQRSEISINNHTGNTVTCVLYYGNRFRTSKQIKEFP